jgi:hypothetical protein
VSRTSRLEKAATRIQSPDDGIRGFGYIGLNRAGVPGGTGSVHLDTPVTIAGYRWDPADGRWDCGAPIGAALALEMAGKA